MTNVSTSYLFFGILTSAGHLENKHYLFWRNIWRLIAPLPMVQLLLYIICQVETQPSSTAWISTLVKPFPRSFHWLQMQVHSARCHCAIGPVLYHALLFINRQVTPTQIRLSNNITADKVSRTPYSVFSFFFIHKVEGVELFGMHRLPVTHYYNMYSRKSLIQNKHFGSKGCSDEWEVN